VATGHANTPHSHQRWAAARPSSLRCYLGAQPGAISPEPTSGLPAHVEGREPEWQELAVAEPHFAVLQVAVQRLEWLHLHTRGQRRALFTWPNIEAGDAAGGCEMQWLNP
jgi:hypothetical protein